jgi:hypothetical protein
MIKKNAFLGLFLCLLGMMPSALALNNDMNNCLQVIYANDEQGIMPSDEQKRDSAINLLKDHIKALKQEEKALLASTTAGRYNMAAGIADLTCGITSASLGILFFIASYRAKDSVLNSLGDFAFSTGYALIDAITDPLVLWRGNGAICGMPAKFYQIFAGFPLIIAASAIGSKMLYRKANRCAQERDERLQEIEKEIVRDYEIIGRLKAVSYMYIC